MTGLAQPARLPGNAQLAPGEQIQMGGRFMYSTAVFYAHTELVLTSRRLYASRPNMAFGFIPVGSSNSAYPVENIAGVSSGTKFDILGVLFGVVGIGAGVLALMIPGAAILGLLLVALGLLVIVGAPKQAISVMNSGGGEIRFPVSFFERQRTVEFANAVSQTLARGAAAPRQAPLAFAQPAADDPAARLQRLEALRGQGLISDAEFAAKRAEVLEGI